MAGRKKATILVKLFATLREGREKMVDFPWQEGLTAREILKELDIPEGEVAILLINGQAGEMDRILLQEDYLSIFPPVGGG